jgi:hypothetical protein
MHLYITLERVCARMRDRQDRKGKRQDETDHEQTDQTPCYWYINSQKQRQTGICKENKQASNLESSNHTHTVCTCSSQPQSWVSSTLPFVNMNPKPRLRGTPQRRFNVHLPLRLRGRILTRGTLSPTVIPILILLIPKSRPLPLARMEA